MAIKEGDRLPEATMHTMLEGKPAAVTTDDLFAGKNVVVFAVPGAYTPTCSQAHRLTPDPHRRHDFYAPAGSRAPSRVDACGQQGVTIDLATQRIAQRLAPLGERFGDQRCQTAFIVGGLDGRVRS